MGLLLPLYVYVLLYRRDAGLSSTSEDHGWDLHRSRLRHYLRRIASHPQYDEALQWNLHCIFAAGKNRTSTLTLTPFWLPYRLCDSHSSWYCCCCITVNATDGLILNHSCLMLNILYMYILAAAWSIRFIRRRDHPPWGTNNIPRYYCTTRLPCALTSVRWLEMICWDLLITLSDMHSGNMYSRSHLYVLLM